MGQFMTGYDERTNHTIKQYAAALDMIIILELIYLKLLRIA